jgi:hypothetical protein
MRLQGMAELASHAAARGAGRGHRHHGHAWRDLYASHAPVIAPRTWLLARALL